jgi:hypothetical protein
MAYAQEVRIAHLPNDTDHRVRAYFNTWRAAAVNGQIPDRKDLTGAVLEPWIDDISIYEYVAARRDFVVRIDAPNIVEASGENYQGCSARQIDLDFGTTVHPTLLEIVETGQPTFHRVGLERRVWEEWLRLMLPVRTVDREGQLLHQVFVSHFFYRGE